MALRPAYVQYPPRGHRRVVQPAIEPVTETELRTHVKADILMLPDSEAKRLIAQAREFIEEMYGIAIINQTWRLSLDAWPGYETPWWDGVREMAITELQSGRPKVLHLPRYPLSSIASVKVYDEASLETVLNVASIFDVDTESRPGRLALKFGQLWPLATRPTNAVVIEYVAGFGALVTDVPAGVRAAVLLQAGYFYDHSGECDMRTAFAKSGTADIMAAYSLRGL